MVLGYKNSFVLCYLSLRHCSLLSITRSTLKMRWLDSALNSNPEPWLLRRLRKGIGNFMTDSSRAKAKSMFNQILSVIVCMCARLCPRVI